MFYLGINQDSKRWKQFITCKTYKKECWRLGISQVLTAGLQFSYVGNENDRATEMCRGLGNSSYHASKRTKAQILQSPYRCLVTMVAHLKFQPWEAETGAPQSKLVFRLAILLSSGFDWEALLQGKRWKNNRGKLLISTSGFNVYQNTYMCDHIETCTYIMHTCT